MNNKRPDERGFVFVTVLILMTTLIVLSTAYFFTTNIEIKSVKVSSNIATGFYSAEAGLNIRAEEIRQEFIDYRRPGGTSPDPEGACEPDNMGDGDFACDELIINDRQVITYVTEDPSNNLENDEDRMINIPPGELFEGLNAIEYKYTAFSEARPENGEHPEAILEMVFRSRLVPLFQFAAFYNKDLEVLPGADMTLNGRVHANGDAYFDSGRTLTIDGHITLSTVHNEGGKLIRNRKDRNEWHEDSVLVNDGASDPPPPIPGEGHIDQIILDDWNGRIETGLDTLTVPELRDFQPEGFYWERSDLVVALDYRDPENPEIIVPDRESIIEGSYVPESDMTYTLNRGECIDPAVFPCDPEAGPIPAGDPTPRDYMALVVYDWLPGLELEDHDELDDPEEYYKFPVEASNGFRDNREGQDMILMEVDIEFLLARMHESSVDDGIHSLFSQGPNASADIDDTTDGGLVLYFTVLGDTPGDYGVRIRNGARLAAHEVMQPDAPDIQGLTIVSDLPVYVQGNFNLNDPDDIAQDHDPLPGEGGDPDYWRPAAIMADTINVLSTSWDSGAESQTNLSNRVAGETRINAAFLAGTDITDGSDYNGGLENYPRLHENWSGVTLYYQGSFVSLYEPEYASGSWSYGSPIYTAPVRNWIYDIRFNNAAYLPPLTPRFVYLKQERFIRLFDR